jgi:hypothetical protein
MGWGDEIMALGQAETLWLRDGRKRQIVDHKGKPRWSPVWEHHPAIVRDPDEDAVILRNGPGCRPYLQYPFIREAGAGFTNWRARDHRGRLHLAPEERARALFVAPDTPFVVIEPGLKPASNPNKQWGKWWSFTRYRKDILFVQLGPQGTEILDGVLHIETPDFRFACAVLALAQAAVLPEGGLHHAAAALGVPAVVIFGGHTHPETTGYPEHGNIFSSPDGQACGYWEPCDHCVGAMASISVRTVSNAMDKLI